MKFLPSVVAAALTAGIVGVGLAIAGSSEDPTRHTDAAADRNAVAGVAPELPRLVAAFRRSRERADDIPGGDPVEGLEQIGAAPGENPRLARRLDVAGGRVVYAWPMSDGVCFSWGGSGGCGSTATLDKVGALVGSHGSNPGSRANVFALVEDGVAEVRLTLANGDEIMQPVQENAVWVVASVAPVELRWRRPDGTWGIQALAQLPGSDG